MLDQAGGQVDRRCRLADPALLVGDRHDPATGGAGPRAVVTRRRAPPTAASAARPIGCPADSAAPPVSRPSRRRRCPGSPFPLASRPPLHCGPASWPPHGSPARPSGPLPFHVKLPPTVLAVPGASQLQPGNVHRSPRRLLRERSLPPPGLATVPSWGNRGRPRFPFVPGPAIPGRPYPPVHEGQRRVVPEKAPALPAQRARGEVRAVRSAASRRVAGQAIRGPPQAPSRCSSPYQHAHRPHAHRSPPALGGKEPAGRGCTATAARPSPGGSARRQRPRARPAVRRRTTVAGGSTIPWPTFRTSALRTPRRRRTGPAWSSSDWA